MLKKTLITGSVAYDVFLGYDGSFADAVRGADADKLSVSFFSPHYAKHHGGTGANIAWNLMLLGGNPVLVSTVGSDGGAYKMLLSEHGVDVTYLEQRDDSVTATAIIGTDTGERQIAFFHPGADALGSWPSYATPEASAGRPDVSDLREEIGYAIVSPRNPVLMMEAAHAYEKLKIPFIFDPGQLIIGLSADELRFGMVHADIIIANAYEWQLLSEKTGMDDKDCAADGATLIVTRGEHGALVVTSEGRKEIAPCLADKVVNPTGAGDALRAGLLYGLENGWEMRHCVRLGAVMGSIVVGLEGTLPESLDRDEVWASAEQTYGEALPE